MENDSRWGETMNVYVLVLYGDSLLKKLMNIVGMTWSHTAFVYEEYEMMRAIEACSNGIIERSFKESIAGAKKWKLFALKHEPDEMTKREMVAFAYGNLGKPYAYHQLFRMAWEVFKDTFLPLRSAATAFAHVCSSLVDAAFLYADIDLVPEHETIWVTPDDLAQSDLLMEVDSDKVR